MLSRRHLGVTLEPLASLDLMLGLIGSPGSEKMSVCFVELSKLECLSLGNLCVLVIILFVWIYCYESDIAHELASPFLVGL